MSSPREIPGFYFDIERQKYFRIQPNHRAPEGAAHSQSAVSAKSRAEKVEDDIKTRHIRQKDGFIHRLDRTTFTSMHLSLRHGSCPRRTVGALAHHFATNLKCRSIYWKPGETAQCITVSNNGNLYCTTHFGRGFFRILQLNFKVATVGEVQMSAAPDYPTQTLVYGDDNFAMFVGSRWAAGKLSPSYRADGNSIYAFSHRITDMAQPPDGNARNLAFVNEKGLYTVSDVYNPTFNCCSNFESQQMIVAFKDNNIVMSGERSGLVNFIDHREPSPVARLKHSSAVSGIVNTRSTNQIIISGLQSVALYDLRYTKAVTKFKTPNHLDRRKSKNKKHFSASSLPSQPLAPFYFPQERQSDYFPSGKPLTYLPSHDIAVIASRRSSAPHDIVTVYDASKGRIIPSPLNSATYPDQIFGLAVGRTRDGPESIFVNGRTRIDEWAVDLPMDENDNQANKSMIRHLPMVGRDQFPPDAALGMAEKWRNGDRGPV